MPRMQARLHRLDLGHALNKITYRKGFSALPRSSVTPGSLAHPQSQSHTWWPTQRKRDMQTCASSASSHPGDPYNAYIDKSLTVQGAPEGPLKGLTFAVKDLFDVAGHRTGFGNPTWLDTHPPAERTAPAVQALLDAGATLQGKTHMDELAYSLNGENVHYGTPVNPAAKGRIPGGSSSGSAVAVACGDVDLGVGTDTGGSIRVPAAFCGLLGVRPSWGRVAAGGTTALAPSFTTPGWFARDAAVLRAAGSVLLDPATRGSVPHLGRWLVARDAFQMADPETCTALQAVMQKHMPQLVELLGQPAEVDVAAPLASAGLGSLTDWMGVFRICQGAEVWQEHGAWVTHHDPRFGPGIRERFAMAAAITREQLAASNAQRAAIRSHMLSLLGPDGVLVLPTTPGPAPPINTPPGELDAWRARLISLTSIAGLVGVPQVHLPIAEVGGLPVGLGLIGPPGGDEALLELTEQLMEIMGGWQAGR